MTFAFAAFFYLVALILSCFLIFFALLQVTAFYLLKFCLFDQTKQIFLCKQLNPFVLTEYITHAILTLLFLCSGEWHCFLLNVPLVAYHVFRYSNRPVMSEPGLYDSNTIMNPGNLVLEYASQEVIYKAIFYYISFKYYVLFSLIFTKNYQI